MIVTAVAVDWKLMYSPYLEVTYRGGRVLAAYYHVAVRGGRKSVRSRRIEPGLIADYSRDGELLGIEITASHALTLAAMNRVLRALGLQPLKAAEFRPLRAAS